MTRQLMVTIASFMLFVAVTAISAERLILCGQEEVFIIDTATETPHTIWSWKASECPSLPDSMADKFRSTDECKPVNGGTKILITSSSDGVALIDKASGRALWWASVVNAHSAEMLPGGRIAVAASHRDNQPGDRLIIFDSGEPGKELCDFPLFWGHGAVWDNGRQLLYALAHEHLYALRLDNLLKDSPKIVLVETIILPEEGGHNLSAVPGSDLLLISTGNHAWTYDRKSGALKLHPQLGEIKDIKSMDTNPRSGQVSWTRGEDGNWWSENVYFINPPDTLTLSGERIYKARWDMDQ